MPVLIGQASVRDGFSKSRSNGVDFFSTVTLNARQPRPLPLLMDHDPDHVAGEVVHIEQHDRQGVVIVATIRPDLDRSQIGGEHGRNFLSLGISRDEITSIDVLIPGMAAQRRADNATLREISVYDRPGAPVFPISCCERDIDAYTPKGGWPNTWTTFHKKVADRAIDYLRSHRHARSLEVQYFDPELDALADDHLSEDRRQRRDEKIIDAIEQQQTAEYLRSKYARQVASQPDDLVFESNGAQVHRRTNIGHIVSVR